MKFKNHQLDKYLNLLSRLGKQFSPDEGLLIMIRSYLTKDIYYYIFCVLFRSLFLIMISGNYMHAFLHKNCQTIQDSSKIFSLHYLFKIFTVDYRTYIKICTILYVLFVIRVGLTINILNQFSSYRLTNTFPTPFKYQVIIEHLVFLFFPFLLEFLVVPYYVYF